ncbi:MAG: ATP-binding protein [Bacteroidetes bacterium]|nr:ATP-binding protein [Bacteroidota bacterium]
MKENSDELGHFGFEDAGYEIAEIPVSISFDIIRLFSEGLYKSPHKAIEELVSNSYDAQASRVHVLLPDPENGTGPLSPLWVIDDGHGMDVDGFRQLWRVADSDKVNASPSNGRLPIGQFGIGKLAAYVLAWRLMHLSRVHDKFLLTAMNFRTVTERQADHPKPAKISLREVSEQTARMLLSDVKVRDPSAWDFLFGENTVKSWTVAGLSDFRDLYSRLSAGTLRWVLSTGLPLHSDFEICLNRQSVVSSKEKLETIESIEIDHDLPDIGVIKGNARIYEKPLTSGKSADLARSHGFFVRVRKRVINLEDELFGIAQPNHAAWTRFALDVHVEGLREHLLSSREGVRDSKPVRKFRKYLLEVFNQCRNAFSKWERAQIEDLDIHLLLSDEPSIHILEPLLRGVRTAVESGEESFYIAAPKDLAMDGASEWLDDFRTKFESKPFETPTFVQYGPHAAAVQYDPSTRRLAINLEHPFVDKLTGDGKNRNPAKLFASSEVLLEGLLQEQGFDNATIADFLRDRDRILRLMAGDAPPSATEAVRLLQVANQNENALERATGATFRILGFRYERRGGSRPGTDGVLFARLGRHGDAAYGHRDYKLVYDAKHTEKPSVPADKIDPSSLESFRSDEGAAYGFFIAEKYAAEEEPEGKMNRKMFPESPQSSYQKLTLLKVEHLERLIQLHLYHGLTLTDLWKMFKECRTVTDVDQWIADMQHSLSRSDVPLAILISALERLKSDTKAVPNVKVARATTPGLQEFSPERLSARLKAVETIIGERWLKINDSDDVIMHQTGNQILTELSRQIGLLDSSDERIRQEVSR